MDKEEAVKRLAEKLSKGPINAKKDIKKRTLRKEGRSVL